MPPKTPRAPKDSTSSTTKQKAQSQQPHEIQLRLKAIHICIETEERENPPDVDGVVQTLREEKRPAGPESPSIKKALDTVRQFWKHGEDEAFGELSRLLTEASEDLNRAAGIRKAVKRPWQAGCVPFMEEADEATRKLFAAYYSTSTPKPDLAYGFHFGPESDETATLDDSPNLRQILDICRVVHFPFLIVEWKSTWFGGNMADAQCQLARAGAAAVQVMDRLHRHSGNADPTTADTCVFSVGIDNNIALFHVHWRGVSKRGMAFTEMRIFKAVTLLEEDHLRELRRVLFLLFKWAREVRLPAVKARVAKLDPSKPTPPLLRDPTDCEAQSGTPSLLEAPSLPTDEGIGHSAISGTRPLSESPSDMAAQRSSKRLRVQDTTIPALAEGDHGDE